MWVIYILLGIIAIGIFLPSDMRENIIYSIQHWWEDKREAIDSTLLIIGAFIVAFILWVLTQ